MAVAATIIGSISFAFAWRGLHDTMWKDYDERIEAQMTEELD